VLRSEGLVADGDAAALTAAGRNRTDDVCESVEPMCLGPGTATTRWRFGTHYLDRMDDHIVCHMDAPEV
jgi:hypothetical protein